MRHRTIHQRVLARVLNTTKRAGACRRHVVMVQKIGCQVCVAVFACLAGIVVTLRLACRYLALADFGDVIG
jgi:hypothetical protein